MRAETLLRNYRRSKAKLAKATFEFEAIESEVKKLKSGIYGTFRLKRFWVNCKAYRVQAHRYLKLSIARVAKMY